MNERYDRGLAILESLNGPAGRTVVERVSDFAPAMGEQLVSFVFGDVYARPQLDLKSRQIVTVAALAALGHALPQLEIHVRGALRVGLSEADLVEIVHHVAPYGGFPAALNALAVVRRVCRPDEDATPSAATESTTSPL